MHPYFSPPTPHLFGHRGASGEAPENTLTAFERAWAEGVPFLEMDCHATRDGEVVVLHDALLDRTTDGSGPVAQLTCAELERLDAGYRFTADGGATFPYRGGGIRVPRLAEVLEALPEARVNLEVKQREPAIEERVIALVRELGAAERVLLAAEDDTVLERIRALRPETAIGMSRGDVIEFFQAVLEGRADAYRPRGQALQIPASFGGRPLVDPRVLESARRVGLRVHVWTINDPDEMRSLLEAGVDGVMSDFPARLLEVARKL